MHGLWFVPTFAGLARISSYDSQGSGVGRSECNVTRIVCTSLQLSASIQAQLSCYLVVVLSAILYFLPVACMCFLVFALMYDLVPGFALTFSISCFVSESTFHSVNLKANASTADQSETCTFDSESLAPFHPL
jgi:hypothetical protein